MPSSQPEAGERPDVITVSVVCREEVRADRADLFVVVKGSSLVTGDAALRKAREVGQLVADLTGHGISENDIELEGVYAEAATGMLGRSSSAKYLLKVRCADLNRLADVLGIITAQKNTTLRFLAWGYPEDEGARARRLDAAIHAANEKARRIAAGLGVTLLGVHSFREAYADPEEKTPPPAALDEDALFTRRRDAARDMGEALGMEVSHTKEVTLQVEVEYCISRFTQDAAIVH
jgi:uncharacterized protein YggE